MLQLRKEGFFWEREDLAALSPYLTSHIKRFGDYLIDLDAIPPALEETLNFARILSLPQNGPTRQKGVMPT